MLRLYSLFWYREFSDKVLVWGHLYHPPSQSDFELLSYKVAPSPLPIPKPRGRPPTKPLPDPTLPKRLRDHPRKVVLCRIMRLFRRDALAEQSFANADEIEQDTRITTAQLNARAKPWVWGRPPKVPRRFFCYRI